jgi:hypothetical protein
MMSLIRASQSDPPRGLGFALSLGEREPDDVSFGK